MPDLRIFLVDDHALVRSGIRAELGSAFRVVGEADEVDAAIEMIVERSPDVVLLDVHLPGGGGLAVIEAVRSVRPDICFLALSVSDAAEDVIGIVRAGARGYVTKTISGPELVDAVRRVAGGDVVFSPRLAGFVLDAFSGMDPGLRGARAAPRSGARLPDPPGATGPAPDRPGLRLQGDRHRAVHLGENSGEPRVGGAPEAPALQPAPAEPVGLGASPGLSRWAFRSVGAGVPGRVGVPDARWTGPVSGGWAARDELPGHRSCHTLLVDCPHESGGHHLREDDFQRGRRPPRSPPCSSRPAARCSPPVRSSTMPSPRAPRRCPSWRR